MLNTKKTIELRGNSVIFLRKIAVLVLLNMISNGICNLAYCSTMMGGPGNDAYYIDRPNNILIEYPNEGIDTVYSSVPHTLGPNFENIILQGTANINATGNELDNVIIGNFGNNILEGKGGNDTYTYSLNGGHDTIIDDSGIDTIKFGMSITPNNISFTKIFSDLKICFNGRLDSSITVKNFFAGNNKIENFTFFDGQIINDIKPNLVNGLF